MCGGGGGGVWRKVEWVTAGFNRISQVDIHFSCVLIVCVCGVCATYVHSVLIECVDGGL